METEIEIETETGGGYGRDVHCTTCQQEQMPWRQFWKLMEEKLPNLGDQLNFDWLTNLI